MTRIAPRTLHETLLIHNLAIQKLKSTRSYQGYLVDLGYFFENVFALKFSK